MIYMFLNGGGMRGGPVHHHISAAPFVRAARTAPLYRFFSVHDSFPGLWPVGTGGYSIEGELYDPPLAMLGDHLLPAEPAELELGVIQLANGDSSLAMVLRATEYASGRHTDISAFGGWHAYRSGRASKR